tara:strand:+ start:395 stop:628 length:234 start_codon:yes stop_codon:yes gene_type:complete
MQYIGIIVNEYSQKILRFFTVLYQGVSDFSNSPVHWSNFIMTMTIIPMVTTKVTTSLAGSIYSVGNNRLALIPIMMI